MLRPRPGRADNALVRTLTLLVAAAVCGLIPGGGSASSTPARDLGAPLYAVTGGSGDRMLSERDPLTLEPVRPAIALDDAAMPVGFSPDRALLAFLVWDQSTPSLRFLDLRALRWLGTVALPGTGTVHVRWIGTRRVLALAERPDGLRTSIVDVEAGRIVVSGRIPGEHFNERPAVEVTPAGTAILLGPFFGSAQVAVVRPSGSVRLVRLARPRVGGTGRELRRIALVADPARSRAFVVGGLDEPVAEIALRKLTVTYHRLRGGPKPQRPTAVDRQAAWLGGGKLALVGFEEIGSRTQRLGLTLVDTRTWKARTLDRAADFVWVASRTLVGQHADGSLTGFSLGGVRRFTVTESGLGAGFPVSGNGRYLYVAGLFDGGALVVDPISGAVVGRPRIEGLAELLSPSP